MEPLALGKLLPPSNSVWSRAEGALPHSCRLSRRKRLSVSERAISPSYYGNHESGTEPLSWQTHQHCIKLRAFRDIHTANTHTSLSASAHTVITALLPVLHPTVSAFPKKTQTLFMSGCYNCASQASPACPTCRFSWTFLQEELAGKTKRGLNAACISKDPSLFCWKTNDTSSQLDSPWWQACLNEGSKVRSLLSGINPHVDRTWLHRNWRVQKHRSFRMERSPRSGLNSQVERDLNK